MESLYEIQSNVEDFMKAKPSEGGRTLWENLVQSSIDFDCNGCDGILMEGVEEHIKKILEGLTDDEMQWIWKETENGISSSEQGFHEVHRITMVHDIVLDVYEAIADSVCQEAESLSKKGRKKKR